MVTIYEHIYALDKPYYTTVDKALERIKNGNSKQRIFDIRAALDKDKADALKCHLPSVCFSGKFSKREDQCLITHSGFLVLDFDNVPDIELKMAEVCALPYVYACWLSPRATGIKALVKIADGSKHREHFEALKELFPLLDEKGNHAFKLNNRGEKKYKYEVDESGINESRVCYESFDPYITINKDAVPFTKTKTYEKVLATQSADEFKVFQNLLKWLSNRNDAFVTGERNLFIFKLASSCCRFGLGEDAAKNLILSEFPTSNDFSDIECGKAISSAYKSNPFGTANFDREILVDKITRKEVKIDPSFYDVNIRPKDVVYGEDVKAEANEIYKNGYASVQELGIPIDKYFKGKRKELTLLSGIGNYGKTQWNKWYVLMRVLKFGEKFASFSPEDFPPEEYYHDYVEMLLGCDCSPKNYSRPNIEIYNNAYDFISKHIFYVYPRELAPTPEYIKERFLELIIKEKIDGVIIDPFNQMTNNYSSVGGKIDQYLETLLSDFTRFAQLNNVYFTIIAHPHKMTKLPNGNYPCPDVFDLSGGAMWSNKCDNILMYHRPLMQTDPMDPTVEFYSKKIKRQKTVGIRGDIIFAFSKHSRRFEFNGVDYMAKLIKEKGLTFKHEQTKITI